MCVYIYICIERERETYVCFVYLSLCLQRIQEDGQGELAVQRAPWGDESPSDESPQGDKH